MNEKKTDNQNNGLKQVVFERNGEVLKIKLRGDFIRFNNLPQVNDSTFSAVKKLLFVDDGIKNWDSSVVLVLYDVIKPAIAKKISYDVNGLPQNLQELVKLAFAVDRKPSHGGDKPDSFLEKLGESSIKLLHKISSVFDFLGDVCKAFSKAVIGKSLMRSSDFGDALNECGPKAMGIVMLISFLVGLILAFVGAVQLKDSVRKFM